jgi:hypothetical protein
MSRPARAVEPRSKPPSLRRSEPSAIPRYAIAVLSVAIAIVVAEILTQLLHTEPIASSMLCGVIFADEALRPESLQTDGGRHFTENAHPARSSACPPLLRGHAFRVHALARLPARRRRLLRMTVAAKIDQLVPGQDVGGEGIDLVIGPKGQDGSNSRSMPP